MTTTRQRRRVGYLCLEDEKYGSHKTVKYVRLDLNLGSEIRNVQHSHILSYNYKGLICKKI